MAVQKYFLEGIEFNKKIDDLQGHVNVKHCVNEMFEIAKLVPMDITVIEVVCLHHFAFFLGGLNRPTQNTRYNHHNA
jgi:hypothetical protein